MMCVYIQAAWKLQSFFHHPSLFSLPVVIHPSPGSSPLLLFSYYTHYTLITSSSIELWTKAQVPLKPVEREFIKTDDFFFFFMIWLHSQNCKCLTVSQHSMMKLLQPVSLWIAGTRKVTPPVKLRHIAESSGWDLHRMYNQTSSNNCKHSSPLYL